MADDNLRQDMVDQVREEQSQRQRPPRFTRAPTPSDLIPSEGVAAPGAVDAALPVDLPAPEVQPGALDVPRKRRRRRRSAGARPAGDADVPMGHGDA